MKAILRIAIVAVLAALGASCAFGPTIQPEDPASIIAGVKVGDEVVVTSKQGKIQHFVVDRMTNKALYGEGYRVGYDEIENVEVKRESWLSHFF